MAATKRGRRPSLSAVVRPAALAAALAATATATATAAGLAGWGGWRWWRQRVARRHGGWNYRLLEYPEPPFGDITHGLHEVYYDHTGLPTRCSLRPVVYAESAAAVKSTLKRLARASRKPVLPFVMVDPEYAPQIDLMDHLGELR